MNEILVTVSPGMSLRFHAGIKISEILPRMGSFEHPLAAVLVDNHLCAVDTELKADCTLSPVTVETMKGARVYRRSLCFLLAIVSRELFPGRRLVAGMAIGTGFYHYYDDDKPLDPEDLVRLGSRMRNFVERDIMIGIEEWPWAKAVKYFENSGQPDTLLLLEHRNDPFIPLNVCAGFRDFHISPLVPSTGILQTWELVAYQGGFLLRYPHKETPDRLTSFKDEPILYSIASEYRERARVLGAGSVGSLNKVIADKTIKDYITIAETLQAKKLAAIADVVASRKETAKVVLIAGPSSSGKTTTTKRLAIQLRVLGFTPIPIELDNYFVDRGHTPIDANGQPDFECLEALDLEYLARQIDMLFSGKTIELPQFDFKSGMRKLSGRHVGLTGKEILMLEGIHGLNDRLLPGFPESGKFKIYVSALTQLNLDDHNRISTTDYRLLRRLVRDSNFRGHGAKRTLGMWESVQRGEGKYIFPYQNDADAVFNSALDYELGVLKVFAEPQLKRVKPTDAEYAEARRIQDFLDHFSPIPAHHVPGDSILREFIGGSDFKY